ncbi:hypothetical protein PUNSTDRAFT_61638, partial [Punctularia strigosozonata HHB-11173 SS5]|uniref:uncharacterized protein n=1 Tax=Punctularia strigosozonata (strain HHB-11173) TaxID=741275 RepID=UPI00044163D1
SRINEAIDLCRSAIETCPADSAIRVELLNSAGHSHRMRFIFFQDQDDLDRAVILHAEAFALGRDGDEEFPTTLMKYGVALQVRFGRAGSPEDIHRAVELQRRALQLLPPGSPDRLGYLTNLALTLCERFTVFGSLPDLDEAITLQSSCVDESDQNHTRRSTFLANLARSLRIRFDQSANSGNLKYIEEAISIGRWCVAASGLPASHLPIALNNLAIALNSRYCHLGNEDDIDEAIALCKQSSALQHPGDPSRDIPLKNLAEQFLARYEYSEDPQDLQAAIALLRETLNLRREGHPLRMTALELLASRLKSLRIAESLPLDAALFALNCGKIREAVELLEQGRAFFWKHRLRTPWEDTDSIPEEECYQSRSLNDSSMKGRLEQQAILTRSRGERLEEVINEIRRIPRLSRFMLSEDYSGLSMAAASGPVIILLPDRNSCYAIIIREGGLVVSERLSTITDEWLTEAGDAWTRTKQTQVQILHKLWIGVAKPVIELLGFSVRRARPRIWWCPAGRLSFLPIHAAGDYTRNDGMTCSSYVVSSYTPTLSSLLQARKTYQPVRKCDCKVLLAAVPEPPASHVGAYLPFTVQEVEAVSSAIPSDMLIPISGGENVSPSHAAAEGTTSTALLEDLPHANILHLACHGVQNAQSPLESGFLMSDGLLTISRLMPVPLPRAFLAFLSACETAKGDKRQPDQIVHLAAAMLFAGFKSVVGTMWSVTDADGPTVAQIVYDELIGGDSEFLDPDDIPYALDTAAQRLRGMGQPPSRWAPYIHLGI